jgi:hypothetical protein
MKIIQLTQDKETRVDDEDYAELIAWKWQAKHIKTKWYAARHLGGGRHLWMHRYLLGAPEDLEVDHEDGDGLNNQRSNLRLATGAQNSKNRKINANNASGFKGVSWEESRQKWRASLHAAGKSMFLGYFIDPVEAAQAYDAAATAQNGEFARTNEMLGVYVEN